MARFLCISSLVLLALIAGIRLTRGQELEAAPDRLSARAERPAAADSPAAAANANTPPASPPDTAVAPAGDSRPAAAGPGSEPADRPRPAATRSGAASPPPVFPLPPELGPPLPPLPAQPDPVVQTETETEAEAEGQPGPPDEGGVHRTPADRGDAAPRREDQARPPVPPEPPAVKAPQPRPSAEVSRPGKQRRRQNPPRAAGKEDQASQWKKAQESWNTPGR